MLKGRACCIRFWFVECTEIFVSWNKFDEILNFLITGNLVAFALWKKKKWNFCGTHEQIFGLEVMNFANILQDRAIDEILTLFSQHFTNPSQT